MYISFRRFALISVDNLIKVHEENTKVGVVGINNTINTKKITQLKCMQICNNLNEYQIGFRKLIETYFNSNEGIHYFLI